MSVNVSAITNVVPLVDGGINAVSLEEVQNSGRNVKAADFVMILGMRKGKGFTSRRVEFSCLCMPNGQVGEPNLEKLFNGASVIAANIAALSKGVVFGVYMKLGKYRNDERPISIYEGSLNTAVLTVDNNDVEYNECGSPTSGIMPHRKVSQTIYIPYVGNDVSLQAVEESLIQDFPAGDCIVRLGVTRFVEGSEKGTINAYLTQHASYQDMKKRNKNDLIQFINNDARLGDGDYIISEKYNTVELPEDVIPNPPSHDGDDENNDGGNDGE